VNGFALAKYAERFEKQKCRLSSIAQAAFLSRHGWFIYVTAESTRTVKHRLEADTTFML